MSRSGAIDLDWASDTYRFHLRWGELDELQEACNAGPQRVLMRLSSPDWRIEDVKHTIRLGLIGGGMEPVKALKLVRTYVEGRPAAENVLFALAILQAALIGVPDDRDARQGDGERIDDLPNEKLRFGKVIAAGAAMGFSPQQVREMSVHDFAAAAHAFAEANSPSGARMSAREADEVWDWMQGRERATVN